MNTKEHTRAERLTVQLPRPLLDTLRAKQAEFIKQTGVRVSLSQTAEAALRRGLESPART